MKNVNEIFDGLEDLDKKSVEFLSKAISRSNLPGFDYLEYKQSIKAMAKLNLDKDTAYQSAFATGTTLGLNKEKLITSAEHYKNILAKEKAQFDAALEKQVQEKIAAKKTLKSKLLEEKKMIEKKLVELNKKLAQMDGKVQDADKAIKGAESKIEEARGKFESTYDRFLESIGEDISYIKEIIK